MTAVTARTAAALLIGNELLSGKVQEANLSELARTLRALGVRLERVVLLPDELALIAEEVKKLSLAYDVVFTSGGVGPTHDDVTIEAIASAFGVKAGIHPQLRELLEATYQERCTPAHLRMALVPEGADLRTTQEIHWPTVVMKNVWVLPGVPEIFRMKLSVVRHWVKGDGTIHSKAVFTRIEEAELKPLLDRVVTAYPNVEVGSYPKWFDPSYKTKITFDSSDPALVEHAVKAFIELLPDGEPQRIE